MRRLYRAAVCVLLQAAALLFCAAIGETGYTMDAVYLENEQALSVSLDVDYKNDSGEAQNALLFNVYANAFRRESTLPYDNATLEKAFPYGYAPSGIEFTSVTVDGAPVRYGFMGANECYLRAEAPVANGERISIHFDYVLLLSENRAFQGCGEDIRLTLFYPSLCVWDGEYALEPTSRAAQFLYADKADFTLRLKLPAGYDLASGAVIQKLGEENGTESFMLSLENASELALAFSRRFYCCEQTLPSGHMLRVFGSERSRCKETLMQAASAMQCYEDRFGALPFKKTDIAFCACASDWSLPGLILLSSETQDDLLRLPDMLAQQYFGCAVTTDPQIDPFLRYGVSCYAALMQIKSVSGEAAFTDALTDYLQSALKMTVPGSLTPDSSLNRFQTEYDFDVVVRKRGAAVMHEICLSMGEDAFLTGLKRYYQQNQSAHANLERFVSALEGDRPGTVGKALVAWLMTIDDYVRHEGDIYR